MNFFSRRFHPSTSKFSRWTKRKCHSVNKSSVREKRHLSTISKDLSRSFPCFYGVQRCAFRLVHDRPINARTRRTRRFTTTLSSTWEKLSDHVVESAPLLSGSHLQLCPVQGADLSRGKSLFGYSGSSLGHIISISQLRSQSCSTLQTVRRMRRQLRSLARSDQSPGHGRCHDISTSRRNAHSNI